MRVQLLECFWRLLTYGRPQLPLHKLLTNAASGNRKLNLAANNFTLEMACHRACGKLTSKPEEFCWQVRVRSLSHDAVRPNSNAKIRVKNVRQHRDSLRLHLQHATVLAARSIDFISALIIIYSAAIVVSNSCTPRHIQ